MIGATLLTFSIFIPSTDLTENITKAKYKEYENYQKQVAMFFPLPMLLACIGAYGYLVFSFV